MARCSDCNGTGKAVCMGCNRGMTPMGTCPTCMGTGRMKCLTCHGTGEVAESRMDKAMRETASTAADTTAPTMPRSDATVSCESCQHFRVPNLLKAVFQERGLATGNAGVIQAMASLADTELAVMEQEQEWKMTAMSTQPNAKNLRWPAEPQWSPHCAKHMYSDVYEVFEIKNRDSKCGDFLLGRKVFCSDCAYFREKTGNQELTSSLIKYKGAFIPPPAILPGVQMPPPASPVQFADAYHSQKQLELIEVKASGGYVSRRPMWLDWCSNTVMMKNGMYPICDYANRHNRCPHHSSLEGKIEMKPVGDTAKTPNSAGDKMYKLQKQNPELHSDIMTWRQDNVADQKKAKRAYDDIMKLVNDKDIKSAFVVLLSTILISERNQEMFNLKAKELALSEKIEGGNLNPVDYGFKDSLVLMRELTDIMKSTAG